jgi:tRNA threonylcarbamoyl adenosine modification protein YeaZ
VAAVLVLAFDTATPAVTAALHDGEGVIAERSSVDGRRHGELLAAYIAELLTEAGATATDVTDLAVGVGPGPFTSLRVGLVTALAFAAARGLPVHGVCSLDVLAWDVETDGPFAVATDARRREVYWATYDGGRTSGPAVTRPADLPPELRALPVAGAGPGLWPELFPRPIDPTYPRASSLASAVAARLRGRGGIELLPPTPLYLRRPDAVEPGPGKAVLS